MHYDLSTSKIQSTQPWVVSPTVTKGDEEYIKMVMTQPPISTMNWKLMQSEAAVAQAKETEGYRDHWGFGITSTANVDFAWSYLKSFFALKHSKIQSNEAWETHEGLGKAQEWDPKFLEELWQNANKREGTLPQPLPLCRLP